MLFTYNKQATNFSWGFFLKKFIYLFIYFYSFLILGIMFLVRNQHKSQDNIYLHITKLLIISNIFSTFSILIMFNHDLKF